jgi:hypothetical protein
MLRPGRQDKSCGTAKFILRPDRQDKSCGTTQNFRGWRSFQRVIL